MWDRTIDGCHNSDSGHALLSGLGGSILILRSRLVSWLRRGNVLSFRLCNLTAGQARANQIVQCSGVSEPGHASESIMTQECPPSVLLYQQDSATRGQGQYECQNGVTLTRPAGLFATFYFAIDSVESDHWRPAHHEPAACRSETVSGAASSLSDVADSRSSESAASGFMAVDRRSGNSASRTERLLNSSDVRKSSNSALPLTADGVWNFGAVVFHHGHRVMCFKKCEKLSRHFPGRLRRHRSCCPLGHQC